MNDPDPNKCYELLHKTIQTGLNLHMPTKTVKYNKYKHKNNAWITKGLIRSIKFRDKLYHKLKNTNCDTTLYAQLKLNLNTYNKILKKAIREAKITYYNNKFYQFKNDIKNTWKTIKEIINSSPDKVNMPKQFKVNNTLVTNKQVIANEFNTFFTNIGKNLASSILQPPNRSISDYLNSPCDKQFNFSKISNADTLKIINSLKSKTSKGFDHLSSALLKQIKDEICEPLTHIINKSLDTGIFPNKLKIAKILPIYKKDDITSIENYRPISILPAISKVLEKVICIQINTHFKDNNLFYFKQYGFRELHSTEMAVLDIIDEIIFSIDEGTVPLNIFIDLSKAFDTLDHDILLKKLKYYGINGNSLSLMKDYLSNRFQYVEIDDTRSDYLPIITGVPQGSILGPILFIIYINDMSNASEMFKCISYADDTTLSIIMNCPSPNTYIPDQTTINEELQHVSDWLKLNKLSLNVSKTKSMIFHKPHKKLTPPVIKTENSEIEYVQNFTLLGLIINNNLSWTPHLNHISKKISKTICVMSKLKHYLPRETLKTIYNALINSHLNYGILCWGYNCNTIYRLQKKAIRTICKMKYNAHTQPLFKQLRILTVPDILTRKMYKFFYKYQYNQLPQHFINSNLLKEQQSTHPHNTRANLYIVPRVKFKSTENCLRFQLPKEINKKILPILNKTNTHSEFGFSFYVKNYLINQYEDRCQIQHCYICNRN